LPVQVTRRTTNQKNQKGTSQNGSGPKNKKPILQIQGIISETIPIEVDHERQRAHQLFPEHFLTSERALLLAEKYRLHRQRKGLPDLSN